MFIIALADWPILARVFLLVFIFNVSGLLLGFLVRYYLIQLAADRD